MKKMPISPKKKLVPGSKIPIAFLIDYLKEGYTISDFISAYPWVKKTNAIKVLDDIKREFSSRYAF